VGERRLIHVPALRNTHLIRLGWNLIDCGSGLIFYLFSTFSCETILCEFFWTDLFHRLRLLPPRRGAPSVSQSADGANPLQDSSSSPPAPDETARYVP
jgi:hypothetical protein